MTDNQLQEPHFPCGPCPLLEALFDEITWYRMMLENHRLFVNETTPTVKAEQLQAQIRLIQGFLDKLWAFYHLAEAHLTAENGEGSE